MKQTNKKIKFPCLSPHLILTQNAVALLTVQSYTGRTLLWLSEYWTPDEPYVLSLQLESWILAGGDMGEILFAAANLTLH